MALPPRRQLHFGLQLTPVVKWLLIVLVGIWVLTSILVRTVKLGAADTAFNELALTPPAVMHGHVWQLLSYAWLHDIADLAHILFNGFALVLLGPELERRWGRRAFIKFYLLTGLFAGVFSVLAGLVAAPLYNVSIVGASGAIFGLVAAWSMLFPQRELLLLFVIPVRVKWLVWIAIAGDFVVLALNGQTDTAIQCHIGGALTGWFLITGNWHPRVFVPRLRLLFRRRTPPARRTYLNSSATSLTPATRSAKPA